MREDQLGPVVDRRELPGDAGPCPVRRALPGNPVHFLVLVQFGHLKLKDTRGRPEAKFTKRAHLWFDSRFVANLATDGLQIPAVTLTDGRLIVERVRDAGRPEELGEGLREKDSGDPQDLQRLVVHEAAIGRNWTPPLEHWQEGRLDKNHQQLGDHVASGQCKLQNSVSSFFPHCMSYPALFLLGN
jgi:hypothetical protein